MKAPTFINTPPLLRHTQGCVILVWSGCSTLIGFVLGFAAAVVLAAWSGW